MCWTAAAAGAPDSDRSCSRTPAPVSAPLPVLRKTPGALLAGQLAPSQVMMLGLTSAVPTLGLPALPARDALCQAVWQEIRLRQQKMQLEKETKLQQQRMQARQEQQWLPAQREAAPAFGLPPDTLRPPPGLEDVQPEMTAELMARVKCAGSRDDHSGACSAADTCSTADSMEEAPFPLLPPQNSSEQVLASPLPPSGTPECPSVGSAGHHLGLCKPCDFIHRGFCRIGADCKFCHLCDAGASRQRKRQKR